MADWSPGVAPTSVGAPGTVHVVNVLLYGAVSALPTRSVTAVLTSTVYVVARSSGATGMSVADNRSGLSVTVDGTSTAAPSRRRTDPVVTDAGAIRSLNVTTTLVDGFTASAAFAGVTVATVGAVASFSKNSSWS